MDKGAHFYRCDFQVHTPKDINWKGERPITDEDRKEYANEFVRKCRELGINAVAITDHHDFNFFPYIKKAAESELDDSGNPILDNQKLIVFPGLELTLSTPPCQAILILDANYPLNDVNQILHLLGITPNPPEAPTTSETTPITNTLINSFSELYDKLNTIENLKGKFIILPNVSEGGRHTLLRAGNSEHYKKMPCVGGYVDGALSQLGTGNQNIVNGKAREWGFKSIAVFQTSDNRNIDFSLLGRHTTWVKWAEPTAEALRQACLAKESRLSQERPEFPQVFITQIDVTNSKFLGSFSIKFNRQYNAIIGGRGTGKSTILEYLRWGLCDMPEMGFSPEEQSEIENRRQNFIEKTLTPYNGEVRITFILNGITHIIKRNSVTKETILKIGNNEFESVDEKDVKRLLPIQAYSQKQLSNVGIRIEELKRFVQLPIANELNNLKFTISDTAKKIKNSYNNLIRKKEILNEIDQYILEKKSLNNQVENLRKTLTGITEEDHKIISKKQKFDNEQNLINNIFIEIDSIRLKISELTETLNKYPFIPKDNNEFENIQIIKSINEERIKKFEELKKLVQQLEDALNEENLQDFNKLIQKWNNIKNDFEQKYEKAKDKSVSNKTQLDAIKKIEIRLQELSNLLSQKESIIKELGEPKLEFEKYIMEWFSLHQEKIKLLNDQSQKFSKLSKGFIKADATKSIDVNQIKELLTSAFYGARISENKTQDLSNMISNSENPLDTWQVILNELRLLAEVKKFEDKTIEIPQTPVLNKYNFNSGNIKKIIERLTPEGWLNIATTEIEFNPEFQYSTNNELEDIIPFSEASAGQQATALLTVLLNQHGAPLIIDQPEDDIDNRAIEDIIKNIWDAKKMRQLIFTSHNANLVVNGDAELVICCDYRESNSQTRGEIKDEGAIDSKTVREEITSVMEGGEKAFRLRKEKYGF